AAIIRLYIRTFGIFVVRKDVVIGAAVRHREIGKIVGQEVNDMDFGMIAAILKWQVEVTATGRLSSQYLRVHNLIDGFQGHVHFVRAYMRFRLKLFAPSHNNRVESCGGSGCFLLLSLCPPAFLLTLS